MSISDAFVYAGFFGVGECPGIRNDIMLLLVGEETGIVIDQIEPLGGTGNRRV